VNFVASPYKYDTPLVRAVANGHAEAAALLLHFDADVNARRRVDGDTPLHIAVR
jgi:ankyrin repeat protein